MYLYYYRYKALTRPLAFYKLPSKNPSMPTPTPATRLTGLGTYPQNYQLLRQQLGHTSWIAQGTLVCRPLLRRIAGRSIKRGPYYLWTSKQKGKTICVALSKAQYQLLAQAIRNNRSLHRTLHQMQVLTLKTVLRIVPGVAKRK